MDEKNQVFDNLAKSFDSSYKEENIDKLSTEIQVFEDKKKQLVDSSKKIEFGDKNFLKEEVKDVIGIGKAVLDKLSNELKIGSPPRMYEVCAKMLESVISGLKELRELNKTIYEIEAAPTDGEKGKPNVNITFTGTGKDLLDMISSAKDKNELDRVDADFKVEE